MEENLHAWLEVLDKILGECQMSKLSKAYPTALL